MDESVVVKKTYFNETREQITKLTHWLLCLVVKLLNSGKNELIEKSRHDREINCVAQFDSCREFCILMRNYFNRAHCSFLLCLREASVSGPAPPY